MVAKQRPRIYSTFIGDITAENVKTFISGLKKEISKRPSEIHLIINSRGGTTNDGFALYDFLKSIDKDIKLVTYGTGAVHSSALCVFLAGQERYATPNTSFVIHGNALITNEKLTSNNLPAIIKSIEMDNGRTVEIINVETKLDDKKLQSFILREEVITPQEAQQYGIIADIRALPEPLSFSRIA